MPDTFSILIVDDEPTVRTLLTEILSPMYRCSSTESAGEAIRLIDSRFFEVALVDMGLPGMTGLGLCQLMIKRSPKTVVIVVSGNSDDQSVAEAMKAGAADYIKKPFNLSHVIATVQRVLESQRPGAVA
jgi:DNA-binding NtrC family response regulator